ncbi:O-antigen ligase family protein [Aquibacillus saliphilus]|uniref:O-antigen ligase family protein n=1 Tax=Aquibacillus saliphilus TaxID=1909422 RepID=UPI001CEFBC28|nr:O-antigen ligase family protein [Aquibacillus saliphilus]
MIYLFTLLFPLFIFPWVYDLHDTIIKYMFFIIFTLSLTAFYFIRRDNFGLRSKKVTFEQYLILALGILIVLSTLLSVDPIQSIFGRLTRYEGSLSFICYFALFFLTYRLVDYKEQKVFNGLICTGIFISIYGILEHFNLDFWSTREMPEKWTRSEAFFDNPNIFGSYLVIITMISIFLLLHTTIRKYYLLYFFAANLFFLTALYSSNRSTLIGLFVSLLFLTIFVVIKRKYLWKRWILLAVTFISIFGVTNALEGNAYLARFLSIFSDTNSLILNEQTGDEGAGRIFIWTESLPLLREHFWIGSGPDTFAEAFHSNIDDSKLIAHFGTAGKTVDKAHNEYLHIGVTLGVPALLIYLLFLFRVLYLAFKSIKYMTNKQKIIHYGLMATIIGYLTQAFFNISMPTVAPLFWILLGLCYGISIDHLQKATNTTSKNEDLESTVAM